MKFLPENKKKQIWSFGLLLVSIAGIVYFNFFSGSEKVNMPPPGGSSPIAVAPESVSNSTVSQTGKQNKLVIIKSQGGLLPYGVKIDLSFLDNDLFKALKGVSALTVKPEELGKDNLFSK